MDRKQLDQHARRISLVVGFWILFSVGCILTPIMVLLYPFAKKHGYITNLVEAADRMVAALLGFSGHWELSVEYAIDPERYKRMHDYLNSIAPDHCEKSAISEGAYCRISDRKMGTK